MTKVIYERREVYELDSTARQDGEHLWVSLAD